MEIGLVAGIFPKNKKNGFFLQNNRCAVAFSQAGQEKGVFDAKSALAFFGLPESPE